MAAVQESGFDELFSKNVPDILEKIFFLLDYDSFKTCFEVSTTWRSLLSSERYKKKAEFAYGEEIEDDEHELVNASASGDTDVVSKILSVGHVSMDMHHYIFLFKRAPLGVAAANGHNEVIRILLDNGADPDLEDQYENYPIHLAAMMGHAETVKLLIDAGTDPDEWGAEGKTPYHYASEEGHQDTIRVLIEAGADPNTRSREDFALCRRLRGDEYDG